MLTPHSPDAAQIDAIALSHALRARLVDFHLDRHWVRDVSLDAALRQLWSDWPVRGGLLSELWVEAAPPSQSSGVGTGQLASDGILSRTLADHLNARGVMPLQRALYSHQRASIELEKQNRDPDERPALVVTAPTGAGKTEAFLLPLLNDLASLPSPKQSGVKAILLYPMNALVNDQVERLEKWLAGQNQWSFFHFTSETPEDDRRAAKAGFPKPQHGGGARARVRVKTRPTS